MGFQHIPKGSIIQTSPGEKFLRDNTHIRRVKNILARINIPRNRQNIRQTDVPIDLFDFFQIHTKEHGSI